MIRYSLLSHPSNGIIQTKPIDIYAHVSGDAFLIILEFQAAVARKEMKELQVLAGNQTCILRHTMLGAG